MYEIIIKKTEVQTKIKGNDWVKLGQVEKERKHFSFEDDRDQTYLSDEMGYSPEIEKKVEVTKEVYSQNVEELDLISVISAVNGMV